MQRLRLLACVVLSLQLASCVTETTVVGSDRQIRPQLDQNEAARTRVALGIHYLQRGDNSQAKFNLEKAKSLAPQLAEVHNALAYYYQQVADFSAAQQSYQHAITLEPANADTYNNYGTFLCQQGHYQQAEELLQKAISTAGYIRVADSYENLALCRLEQKDFIQAKAYLELSIQHNSTRPSALFNLASVHYAMADLTSARQLLQRIQQASQISPRAVLLDYLIAQEQYDTNRMSSAERLLMSTYPQSREALLLSQGKLDESEFSQLRQQYQGRMKQAVQGSKTDSEPPKIKVIRKPVPLVLTAPPASPESSQTKVLQLSKLMQSQRVAGLVQHQAQQDESLYGIAERYSVTISDIISWNFLRDNQPVVKGQILWIGQQAPRQIEPQIEVPERYQIRDKNILSEISARYRVKLTNLLQWNNLTEQSPMRVL